MQPEPWILERCQRLCLDEFRSVFAACWSRLESRFLKLECWQSYQELEASRSQDAFKRGDRRRSRELLRDEAELDRPLYERIRAQGIDYARIRLVQEPLTPYLEYELMAYEIRSEMGENIVAVRWDPGQVLPSKEYFDFLLFDRREALIHDYGDTGRQVGGWISQDIDLLERLDKKAVTLRKMALSLGDFLAGWRLRSNASSDGI